MSDKVRFKQYNFSTSPKKLCLCFVHFFSDSQLRHSLQFHLQNYLVRERNSCFSPLTVSVSFLQERKKKNSHFYRHHKRLKKKTQNVNTLGDFPKKKERKLTLEHLKSANCLHKRLEAEYRYLYCNWTCLTSHRTLEMTRLMLDWNQLVKND